MQLYYACILKGCISHVSHIQYFIYCFIYCFRYCLIYYLMYCFIFYCVLYRIMYYLMYCLIYYCVLYSASFLFRISNMLCYMFDTFSVLSFELKPYLKSLGNWNYISTFKLCLILCFNFKFCFAINHSCNNTTEGIGYI